MSRQRELYCTITNAPRFTLNVPSILVTLTPPKGQAVEATLEMTSLVAGTGADCDLIAEDGRVSRRHCELSLCDQGIRVRDLGSKNGTFVNDIRVVEAIIAPDVAVTIGNSRLVTRVAGTPTLVPLSRNARFGKAVGGSAVMRALFAKLERVAATSETILLLGESGTGKEVLAQGVHDASPRRDGPFVVFDCSAVAPTLIEAELFGCEPGAFTGAVKAPGLLEQADGGTLFIDELGELPLDLQPKLLRALEARQSRRLGARGRNFTPFDARVIAATHRDLRGRVAAGTFRQDLYYRLAVVELVIPPLRERKDDIPLLVERFLAAQMPPRTLTELPTNALGLLMNHHWPGNVRELRNVVTRLMLFPNLAEEALSPGIVPDAAPGSLGTLLQKTLKDARESVVEKFERAYITAKLKEHGGNVTRAAESMGVSRQFLYRLMEQFGIRS